MATYLTASSASANGQVDISTTITPSGTDRLMLAFGQVGDNTPSVGTIDFTSDLAGTLTESYTPQEFNTYAAHASGYLLDPSTSLHTVTLNRDAQYNIAIMLVTFEDVDQATPFDTWQFDTGANAATTVSSATGDTVVSFLSADDPAIEVAGDLTSRLEDENFASEGWSVGVATAAGAASVNAAWTNVTGSYGAGTSAVNINQAGGGGGSSIAAIAHHYRMMKQR